MATLKQLIEKASQLPKQEYELWDEDLLSALGLDIIHHNYEKPVNLTTNHLKQWCCTDTWVGVDVIYLNNSPVAVKWEAKAEAYKEAADILANAISE